MPLQALAKAMKPCPRVECRSASYKNVLPAPPGPSIKKEAGVSVETLCMISSKAAACAGYIRSRFALALSRSPSLSYAVSFARVPERSQVESLRKWQKEVFEGASSSCQQLLQVEQGRVLDFIMPIAVNQ